VSDSPHSIRVALVGAEGSGVRTLIGSLSGSLSPSSSGERLWDDLVIHLSAGRPTSVNLTDTGLLVVVVSAKQGVPSSLASVWQEAAERAMPAVVVVTHVDDATVDLDEVTAMCQRVLSDGGEVFLPWLPILDDHEGVCGFISLLSEEIVDWSDGGPVRRESETRHQELIEDSRAELCESVMLAVSDDQLFASYMSGTPIDGETIEAHMHEQIGRGLRHPVLGVGLTPHLLGVGLLLDTISAVARTRG
jgi:translation elongation factor EF-G